MSRAMANRYDVPNSSVSAAHTYARAASTGAYAERATNTAPSCSYTRDIRPAIQPSPRPTTSSPTIHRRLGLTPEAACRANTAATDTTARMTRRTSEYLRRRNCTIAVTTAKSVSTTSAPILIQ
jgi:hypothetical protein